MTWMGLRQAALKVLTSGERSDFGYWTDLDISLSSADLAILHFRGFKMSTAEGAQAKIPVV